MNGGNEQIHARRQNLNMIKLIISKINKCHDLSEKVAKKQLDFMSLMPQSNK